MDLGLPLQCVPRESKEKQGMVGQPHWLGETALELGEP